MCGVTDRKKINGHDHAGMDGENIVAFERSEDRPQPRSEPAFNLPPATQFLILANLAIHVLRTFVLGEQASYEILYRLGFVSARYTGGLPLTWEAFVSPLTYMFIHGSWTHVLMNVAMLAAFGAGIERQMGSKKMLSFFLMTGFLSAWFHMLFYWSSEGALIGASGGISGLFGGVLMMLYSRGHLGRGTKSLYPAIAIWIGTAILFGIMGAPGAGDATIAWTAHIGGFIAGLALYRYFSRS